MEDTKKIINPSKGGRGQKSDYPTVTIRVPQVLKESIQETIIKFYQGDVSDNSSDLNNLQDDANQTLVKIRDLVSKFKTDNKVTKRQVKLYELITQLEEVIGEI